MELERFVNEFAQQFDETDPSEITSQTDYKGLDEWSSMTSMAIIAFVKTQYGKNITGKEIRQCSTVEDLFNLVNNK